MMLSVERLARFIDVLSLRHDPYENDHAHNSATLVRGLAEAAGYPSASMDTLILATRLHDLGKMLIPETVLNKRGRLTTEEIAHIHRHVLIGYDAVMALGLDPIIPQIVLEHHECWDGMGYPAGLRGEQICIEARMVAIVDTFDALTSNRAYRKALTLEDAEAIMRSGKGFDPELLDLFFSKVVRVK